MASLALALLAAAVLLGGVLAVLHLRGDATGLPPLALGLGHAFFALGGLVCVLLALGEPRRGIATGTAAFPEIAAGLLAAAAVAGGGIRPLKRGGRRFTGTLVGAHATLAVSGFVFLAAYLFAG